MLSSPFSSSSAEEGPRHYVLEMNFSPPTTLPFTQLLSIDCAREELVDRTWLFRFAFLKPRNPNRRTHCRQRSKAKRVVSLSSDVWKCVDSFTLGCFDKLKTSRTSSVHPKNPTRFSFKAPFTLFSQLLSLCKRQLQSSPPAESTSSATQIRCIAI